jgi:hypothetical protein
MTDNILTRVGSLETAAKESREFQAQRNAELSNRLADLEGAVGLGLPHAQTTAFPAIDAAYPAAAQYCQQPFVAGLSVVGEPLLAQGAEPIPPQWALDICRSLAEVKRELAERRDELGARIDEIAEEALREDTPKRRGRPPGSRNRSKATR